MLNQFRDIKDPVGCTFVCICTQIKTWVCMLAENSKVALKTETDALNICLMVNLLICLFLFQ